MNSLLNILVILIFVTPYVFLTSRIVRDGGPEHRYPNCIVTGETEEYHNIGLKVQGELVIPNFNFKTYTLQMDCKGEKIGFETLNSRSSFGKPNPTDGCEVSYATVPEHL